jgi:hypothetical protein
MQNLQNNNRDIATVPQRFLDYEFEEIRSVVLTGIYTGFNLVPNQRCYFGPNSQLRGKRLVAVSSNAVVDTIVVNGADVVPLQALPNFLLTLVNKKGNQCISQWPVTDLDSFFNSGKKRIFNVDNIDLENSYVESTTAIVFPTNYIMLFNFFTVSW